MFRILLCLLGATLARPSPAAAASPLAGTWQFDASSSTELSPWTGYELTITESGGLVTFDRHLGSGRREFRDSMTVETGAPFTIIPVTMWPDNRHLGAYIGGDQTKRVHAEWLDTGRILRLSTDLVLATSQGERFVNILSNYQVSANGTRLTLTELRSTRNRPIVYVFTRVAPAQK